ncbi:MAG TPA: TIGR01212 family radical SAM protein [Mollicutes bacterium]|nr:TIGR01212 family radical SAM protein [Mollicutes bacterium]
MKQFEYTLDNKRYHTLNYYYKNKFNCKIAKISLDAHFTCPNIDGKVGYGGCIYCKHTNTKTDLLKQFEEQKRIIDNKWPNSKYIGYFQSNTNTYAPLRVLKEKYEFILNMPNIIGLSISTRPDAIEDDVLDYLEELNKKTYITIELGLQTIHEKTSKLINRCHSLDCFTDMVSKLRQRKIDIVVHIINGLPNETKDMMLETVKYISKLDIQGIKIHMLHIVKGTPLETYYKKHPFHILTKEEYIDIVCEQLTLLPKEVVIHRLTGDPIKEDLITPSWVLKKVSVLNDIDKEMVKRNIYQGDKYNK